MIVFFQQDRQRSRFGLAKLQLPKLLKLGKLCTELNSIPCLHTRSQTHTQPFAFPLPLSFLSLFFGFDLFPFYNGSPSPCCCGCGAGLCCVSGICLRICHESEYVLWSKLCGLHHSLPFANLTYPAAAALWFCNRHSLHLFVPSRIFDVLALPLVWCFNLLQLSRQRVRTHTHVHG